MRLLVQIAAIFAFVLASSQFSHGHETSSEMKPHVHGHEIASTAHPDDSLIQIGHDNIVHCGAHLLLLVSDTTLAFPRTYQAHGVFARDEQSATHLTFDPPPPRV